MIYVLIMVLTVSATFNPADGYPVVIRQEFPSYEACTKAGDMIQKQALKRESKVKVFVCAPKGTP